MNSKMHSDPPFRETAWRKRAPCSSMTTSSPGRSSRSRRAPIRSSAHVSDASTQASSRRPTTSGRIPSGSRKPARPRSESTTAANAPSMCDMVSATASARSADGCCAIRAAITSVSEVDSSRTRRSRRSARRAAVLVRLPLWPSAIAPLARVAHDRLRVLPHRRAGGGVAGVADRDVAREAGEARLVEHLVHEAHVLHRHHARAVRDGDPGALLAAVLERIEAEVGEPRDVAVVIAGRVVDAEDAAHQAVSSASPSARGMAPS